ncbi:MAG: S8 family serine peptidase [Cyclobacteriaceae bacterium]|nr:S8 family serine peptidase [Cyclobacteriaceae bacterium]
MATCGKKQLSKIKPDEANTHLPKNKDGLLDMQWNHNAVKAKEALAICKAKYSANFEEEAKKIVVVQLDTGWSSHPAVYTNKNYLTNQSVNYVNNETDFTGQDLLCNGFGGLDTGHGTSTTFTVMGKSATKRYMNPLTENRKKVSINFDTQYNQGLFPYVTFIPVRIHRHTVFNLKNKLDPHIAFFNGVKYALSKGADIISLCMGGDLFDRDKRIMIEAASKLAYDNGALLICAAGNGKAAKKMVGVVKPAEFPFTIAVGGVEPLAWVDKKDESNKEQRIIPWGKGVCGPQVDISAPAKFVFTSLKLENKDVFKLGHGTSQATMHVVAAACMWLLVNKQELAQPWFTSKKQRIVEAFRWALRASKQLPLYWKAPGKALNSGILDMENLLLANFSPNKFMEDPVPYFDVTKDDMKKLRANDHAEYKAYLKKFRRYFKENVGFN